MTSQATWLQYTLRIILVMDSLQLPNVQVSNPLQLLQFGLDLCFFLQKHEASLVLLSPGRTLTLFTNKSQNPDVRQPRYLFQMNDSQFENLLLLVILRQ